MKTRLRQTLPLLAATCLLAACGNGDGSQTTKDSTGTVTTTTTTAPVAAITLADVPPSPDFQDAQLSMTSVKGAMKGTDSVTLSFAFAVKNYELKGQTPDAAGKNCNNSKDGQHIHFIMDNKPYTALYEPKHETTVAPNSEHTLVCFLSRSYHESIKHPQAALVYHFKVDEKGAVQKLADIKEPVLAYSRPKGDYLGKDTANVLLDWYLFNASLGADYKIKADVKNNTTGATASFTLTEWKPKFLQGLGTGKATVTLTLLDKDGKEVSGAMTKVSRDIRLAAAEPMP